MAASVAVAVDRLAGELGHQFGLGDGVEDAARPPGGPVLGKRSARLAHEPHRNPVDAEPRQARMNGASSNRPAAG